MSNEATTAKPSLLAHESRLNSLEEKVANLITAINELQSEMRVSGATLPADDAARNAWIDNVLHKFHSGDRPEPADAVAG